MEGTVVDLRVNDTYIPLRRTPSRLEGRRTDWDVDAQLLGSRAIDLLLCLVGEEMQLDILLADGERRRGRARLESLSGAPGKRATFIGVTRLRKIPLSHRAVYWTLSHH